MRVHLFGGVLAYDFLLAGWLRARGVDAHYFCNLKRNEGDYPWWEDRTLSPHNLPTWCHYFPFQVPYLYRRSLGSIGEQFLEAFDHGADLLVLIGEGVFIASHFRTPYAVWSCGFDVAAAVPAPVRWSAILKRMRGRYEPMRLQQRLNRRHVADALHNAKSVISVMEFQRSTFLRQLSLDDKVKSLRMPYDCSRYTPRQDAALNQMHADVTTVFLLPTRHSYGFGGPADKGADKAIKAFAAFVRAHGPAARLVTVEKGPCVEDSKRLVAELGMGAHVQWVPHLDREALRAYYSLPNVVVLDQFQNETTIEPAMWRALRTHGARGSIFAEAMCMGVPLISNLGTTWIQSGAAPPFVWDACAVDEISAAMGRAGVIPPKERHERAKANREWALSEIHWESVIDTYIDHFHDLVNHSRATDAAQSNRG